MVQIIRDNARRLERMVQRRARTLAAGDRRSTETIRVRPYLLNVLSGGRAERQHSQRKLFGRGRPRFHLESTEPTSTGAVEPLATTPRGTAAASPEACASRFTPGKIE